MAKVRRLLICYYTQRRLTAVPFIQAGPTVTDSVTLVVRIVAASVRIQTFDEISSRTDLLRGVLTHLRSSAFTYSTIQFNSAFYPTWDGK